MLLRMTEAQVLCKHGNNNNMMKTSIDKEGKRGTKGSILG